MFGNGAKTVGKITTKYQGANNLLHILVTEKWYAVVLGSNLRGTAGLQIVTAAIATKFSGCLFPPKSARRLDEANPIFQNPSKHSI